MTFSWNAILSVHIIFARQLKFPLCLPIAGSSSNIEYESNCLCWFLFADDQPAPISSPEKLQCREPCSIEHRKRTLLPLKMLPGEWMADSWWSILICGRCILKASAASRSSRICLVVDIVILVVQIDFNNVLIISWSRAVAKIMRKKQIWKNSQLSFHWWRAFLVVSILSMLCSLFLSHDLWPTARDHDINQKLFEINLHNQDHYAPPSRFCCFCWPHWLLRSHLPQIRMLHQESTNPFAWKHLERQKCSLLCSIEQGSRPLEFFWTWMGSWLIIGKKKSNISSLIRIRC